jgi:ADP-dependent NAD(P)H-hydrate dehydratase / NAD(P)H-hydrate epimerase
VPAAADPLLLDDTTVAQWLPAREPRGHKGSNGTLVCVCGSLDYAGAALLSSSAAARVGTGLVALAIPASLQPVFAGRVPEVITIGLTATDGTDGPDGPDIDAQAAGHAFKLRDPSAIVFGCGIRETSGYSELLLGLLVRNGPPMVVDGGGLNLLASATEWWTGARRECVLTPHPGEFARLTGSPVPDSDEVRLERAVQAAKRFDQVVVLKGAETIIAAPDGRVGRSPFVNPALSTAGTGDVLAGSIGGLLAQGVAPFEAACLGVYLHGAAAAHISERLGDAGLLASDLPHEIALARHRLSKLRERPGAGRVGFTRR